MQRADSVDEGRRADSLPDSNASHDPTIETVLRAGIAQKGPALLYAPAVLRSLLEEKCPGAAADIALLLVALEEQVPEALLGVYSDEEMLALTRRLEDQLRERRSLDRPASAWAVGTWARALRAGPVDVPKPAAPLPDGLSGGISQDAGDLPAWLSDTRTGARPFTRWHAFTGVLAAVVIAAIALYVNSQRAPKVWTPAPATPPATPLAAPVTSAPPVVAEPSPLPPEPARTIAPPPVVESAPAATQAPTITSIAVPTPITAGRRFSLTIDYRPGSGKPVSIERRSITGRIGAAGAVVVKPIAQLAGPGADTLRYPLPAVASPSRSTLEFTLVDADGTRSDPRRVVVDVVAAKPGGAPVPCSRTTCGSVVSIREIATSVKVPGRLYETVVRMDDRTMRTVRQPNRWKAGARVRLTAGGRFVAVDKGPPKSPARPSNERTRAAR